MLPMHALLDADGTVTGDRFDLGEVTDRFTVETSCRLTDPRANVGKVQVVLEGSLSGTSWHALLGLGVTPEGCWADVPSGPVLRFVRMRVVTAVPGVLVSAWVATPAQTGPGVHPGR